jgi:hypothetical protein
MIAETQFTVEDFRKRIQAMNDTQLLRYGKAAAYMADPKHSANGRTVEPVYQIQLTECRAETCRQLRESAGPPQVCELSLQEASNPFHQLRWLLRPALPHGKQRPAVLSQCRTIPRISQPVLPSLVAPEGCVGCGLDPPVTTTMDVPEAAVNENDFLATRQNDIGLAGQVCSVEFVLHSQRVEY